MSEKECKTVDAVLRLFTAQGWAYTPHSISKWIFVNTNSCVTEEQVKNYIARGIQMRETGQWSRN